MLDLVIAWTRVHTMNVFAVRSNARPLQGKTVWEHSPTRKKHRENLRLNRGAPLHYHSVTVPPLLPGPTISVGPPYAIPPARWRPTRAPTWTLVLAWPFAMWPRLAPHAPRVGHPRPCHMASEPCRIRVVVPRSTCRLAGFPARHISTCR